MRPIEFRFWSPQGKAFVQDYKYNGFVEDLFAQDKFLIPQQYTGIKDKKDKKVFEGDFVQFKPEKDQKVLAVVAWGEEAGGFQLVCQDSKQTVHARFNMLYCKEGKVIGNILQNDQLIYVSEEYFEQYKEKPL